MSKVWQNLSRLIESICAYKNKDHESFRKIVERSTRGGTRFRALRRKHQRPCVCLLGDVEFTPRERRRSSLCLLCGACCLLPNRTGTLQSRAIGYRQLHRRELYRQNCQPITSSPTCQRERLRYH